MPCKCPKHGSGAYYLVLGDHTIPKPKLNQPRKQVFCHEKLPRRNCHCIAIIGLLPWYWGSSQCVFHNHVYEERLHHPQNPNCQLKAAFIERLADSLFMRLLIEGLAKPNLTKTMRTRKYFLAAWQHLQSARRIHCLRSHLSQGYHKMNATNVISTSLVSLWIFVWNLSLTYVVFSFQNSGAPKGKIQRCREISSWKGKLRILWISEDATTTYSNNFATWQSFYHSLDDWLPQAPRLCWQR